MSADMQQQHPASTHYYRSRPSSLVLASEFSLPGPPSALNGYNVRLIAVALRGKG